LVPNNRVVVRFVVEKLLYDLSCPVHRRVDATIIVVEIALIKPL
jgi:hypothetical protein